MTHQRKHIRHSKRGKKFLAGQRKVGRVLSKYKHHKLYTHGRLVRNRKQSIAIALNEGRKVDPEEDNEEKDYPKNTCGRCAVGIDEDEDYCEECKKEQGIY